MKKQITLQTAAAIERIQESLMGKTEDDLDLLVLHLEELLRISKEVKDITACFISGDC